MKKFKEVVGEHKKVLALETALTGKLLLTTPELNKGSAFTHEERIRFNLVGKLPAHVETLDEQAKRYYEQYVLLPTDLSKNKYLNSLRQHNNVAFFKLVTQHLDEMLPIVYTPTIGDAVKNYSFQFDSPRGLHFSYEEADNVEMMMNSVSYPEVELIVISDGEGVLGIGDWGAGGVDICVGKAMVYTLCGGMNPRHILPIQIDVGTNNKTLLDDPMYLGWHHPRIEGEEYDAFIDLVFKAIVKKFPHVFIHCEDFGTSNARKILSQYQDQLCLFNDDIQGTGATALACVLSGLKVTSSQLVDQRFVIFGAGTAGVGIADQLMSALQSAGLSREEACRCFWLIDRPGLLLDDMDDLYDFQRPYARPADEWIEHEGSMIKLQEVIESVKPTVLIGSSAVAGAFNQSVVEAMVTATPRPMIFPLSNPNSRVEAVPQDIYQWSKGKAIVATGSPFDDVLFNDKRIRISQCNNAFIFPGLGLGVVASGASRVTDHMITQAALALAECSPLIHDPDGALLPSFDRAHSVSQDVALAVANAAAEDGVARIQSDVDYAARIAAIYWEPAYLPYHLNPELMHDES